MRSNSTDPVIGKKQKISSILFSVILGVISYLLIVKITDNWFCRIYVPPGKNNRAAIAIRDNVNSFQKWGSKNFTAGYLQHYYGCYWYFTESSNNNCKKQFQQSLKYALSHYSQVDIYLLAHQNSYIYWVDSLPPHLLTNIHLVYNTGCDDIYQGKHWLKLGADAYIGHYDQSSSPVFYFYFLRRWTRGYPAGQALAESNQLMKSFLTQIEFLSFSQLDADHIFLQSEAELLGNPDITIGGRNQ
ncbi:MAG: hypothetical protein ACP5FK_08690 [bacterium]